VSWLVGKAAARFMKKHPKLVLAGAAFLVLAVLSAMWLNRETVRKSGTSTHKRTTQKKTERTVLATADVVITAEGGETEVVLDASGAVRAIKHQGGTLRVQARSSASTHEDSDVTDEASSSTSYESSRSGPTRRSAFGIQIGAAVLQGGIGQVDVGLKIGRILFLDVGAGVVGQMPIEKASTERRRIGARIYASFP
jgi:hypothetical protein